MEFRFSRYAKIELSRRGIPESMAETVLEKPQQVISGGKGRRIYQSKLVFPDGKTYLLRVIVDETTDPALVITVYRTSKIEKYWRE